MVTCKFLVPKLCTISKDDDNPFPIIDEVELKLTIPPPPPPNPPIEAIA